MMQVTKLCSDDLPTQGQTAECVLKFWHPSHDLELLSSDYGFGA